jgi:hypothetical protein
MIKRKATKSTPEVIISVEECIFKIKGYSFANDADNFYNPIIKYIDDEFGKLECELICEFYFNIFNSVTYKYVLNMMSKFMAFNKEGKKINIIWYYDSDDEDNKESAEDLNELFNLPFELKEINL